MQHVTTHHLGRTVVVELDGRLDVVAGHDLRRVLEELLVTAPATISMDLSRVTGVDEDGHAALSWCTDRAVAARRVLLWSSCSAPMVRDLRCFAHRMSSAESGRPPGRWA